MQLITRYRSYSSLFWLSHEPFAVSRIKDLSTYLIYISLVLAGDRWQRRFRRNGGGNLPRSIEEGKFEKTPALRKPRGVLNILPGRTATYLRIGKGFLLRDIRQIVPYYQYTRLLWSTKGRNGKDAGRSPEERLVKETKAISGWNRRMAVYRCRKYSGYPTSFYREMWLTKVLWSLKISFDRRDNVIIILQLALEYLYFLTLSFYEIKSRSPPNREKDK